MEKITRYIYTMMLCVLISFSASAQEASAQEASATADTVAPVQLADSIEVSILTCTPGTDLYAKFGHTALRVKSMTSQKDVVFNYGCFDGSANDFVFKFLLGQTDYLLEAEPYDYLVARYGYMGNGVKEQVLNLTQKEANQLLYLLIENIRPENQEYRYVWLYDNCTERARDMVERAVGGKVLYERPASEQTIRQMLHECLKNDPWVSFGIDLILGDEIDRPADRRIQMFLPDFFSGEADKAYIVESDGSKRPYIKGTNSVIQETIVRKEASVLTSPLMLMAAVLMVAVLLFIQEWKRGRYSLWGDVILHGVQGLMGLLIGFLFFFSSHPAVDSNWLVIILNPIPLFYAAWLIYCQKTGRRNFLSYVNLVVLAGFVVVMLTCPQSFNVATYLLVLSFLVRAMSQAHFTYHGAAKLKVKEAKLQTK